MTVGRMCLAEKNLGNTRSLFAKLSGFFWGPCAWSIAAALPSQPDSSAKDIDLVANILRAEHIRPT